LSAEIDHYEDKIQDLTDRNKELEDGVAVALEMYKSYEAELADIKEKNPDIVTTPVNKVATLRASGNERILSMSKSELEGHIEGLPVTGKVIIAVGKFKKGLNKDKKRPTLPGSSSFWAGPSKIEALFAHASDEEIKKTAIEYFEETNILIDSGMTVKMIEKIGNIALRGLQEITKTLDPESMRNLIGVLKSSVPKFQK